MIEFLRLLAGTVLHRPYVFIFFGCYLFLAVTQLGWRKTALYTALAYLFAFSCEYSSVHNGFPFGPYQYIQATRDQELWIAGVPFMDSLSFTFLSYVSWQMAILLRLSAVVPSQEMPQRHLRNSWKTAALTGFLMMCLDIIIDPLALRGSKWFLGQIYYYPDGGIYFGVPISNFLGWWFVGFVVVMVYGFAERWLLAGRGPEGGAITYRFRSLGAPTLYFGVLGFNLGITFGIGETLLATVGTIIALLLFLPLPLSLAAKRSR